MSIFGAVKCNISRASRGLRPLGPHQGPALDPLGGLKPPRPPAAKGNDLTVIVYRASGTIIPTQAYPSPSTNSYTQSKTLQHPTNFSSTFGAVGQGRTNVEMLNLKIGVETQDEIDIEKERLS